MNMIVNLASNERVIFFVYLLIPSLTLTLLLLNYRRLLSAIGMIIGRDQ